MRRNLVGLAVVLGLSAFAPPANAQLGVFSDPFSLYYGFYLPRQAALATQRTSQDIINDGAIARQQNVIGAERSSLYEDIQPFALDELDPSKPFGRTRGMGRSYEHRAPATFGNAKAGMGHPAYFNNGASQYHPGLAAGRGPNQNVRTRGGAGGGMGRGRGIGGPTSAGAYGSSMINGASSIGGYR